MRVVANCLCSGSRACSASKTGSRLEIPSVNRVSDCSRTMTACATASSRYCSVSCVACSCREVRSTCQRVEHPLPVLSTAGKNSHQRLLIPVFGVLRQTRVAPVKITFHKAAVRESEISAPLDSVPSAASKPKVGWVAPQPTPIGGSLLHFGGKSRRSRPLCEDDSAGWSTHLRVLGAPPFRDQKVQHGSGMLPKRAAKTSHAALGPISA